MRIVIFMLFLSVMYADNCNNEQNDYKVAVLEYKIAIQNLDQQEQMDLDTQLANYSRKNLKTQADIIDEITSPNYNSYQSIKNRNRDQVNQIKDIFNIQNEVRNFYDRQRITALEKLNLAKLKLQRCKNKR
ncbi:hypothetical protein [Campylobacter insulaenigrae]|uniref:Uncharacterized protein n=1 Tax=Campylobacter insulaenigrae NCTC 12927 TaxID=1031564 RepID=A0A0A8GZ81_9BACT|nr:hypothetical protein [Campylobacter insulaenigrae]AJC87238.1 hypothetical protein CINS_0236 [Campylobacter insulaenigrae NCTC 12927]MCR6578930.1 hypothetical protein [Campylobacter insulaenigrae]MCR6587627.1 hypothetical protein [Campylobacter insulaenigrae]VEH93078.1 Uncharacterised protein [Campylobacter insulaenigrae]